MVGKPKGEEGRGGGWFDVFSPAFRPTSWADLGPCKSSKMPVLKAGPILPQGFVSTKVETTSENPDERSIAPGDQSPSLHFLFFTLYYFSILKNLCT